MSDALMKYETIDSEQIEDIMEGREPRPPRDWDSPDEPPAGSGVADDEDSVEEGKSAEGPIGGPAGQH